MGRRRRREGGGRKLSPSATVNALIQWRRGGRERERARAGIMRWRSPEKIKSKVILDKAKNRHL